MGFGALLLRTFSSLDTVRISLTESVRFIKLIDYRYLGEIKGPVDKESTPVAKLWFVCEHHHMGIDHGCKPD